ncbi:MAG: Na+/H+ antiporter subunit E [Beijerinckiaceae bacterium]
MRPSGEEIGASAGRLAFFGCLWLMIAGPDLKALPVGAIVAIGATWTSMKLSPPAARELPRLPLARLFGRFMRGSIVAGFDVALRALSPRMRLAPGFVACPLALGPGERRNAFCFYQSLQPGVLPTGIEEGRLMVHALDTGLPVAAGIASDEALFDAPGER